MSVIPAYWYVEPYGEGMPFYCPPGHIEVPSPVDLAVIVDPATGEIHGEAVLMSAAPWPRIRTWSVLDQVILPHWRAVSLEEAESALFPVVAEFARAQLGAKFHGRALHMRVKVEDVSVYCEWFHGHTPLHWLGDLPGPASPACHSGEERGEPVKGLSVASLDRGAAPPLTSPQVRRFSKT